MASDRRSRAPVAEGWAAVAGGACAGAALAPWPAAALLAGPLVATLAARGLVRTAAAATLLGLLLGASASRSPAAPFADGLAGVPLAQVLEGTAVEAEPPGPGGQEAILDLAAVGEGPHRREATGRVRLTIGPGRGRALVAGDRVRAAATLERIRPTRNPGGRDEAARWRRRGVLWEASAPSPASVEALGRADGLGAAVERVRRGAARRFDRLLDDDDAGLARALVLGDRARLSLEDRRRFRGAGQSHLVAVSGLHVTLLVGALLAILRRAGLPRRAAAAVGIVAILLYVPFSGAAPSAVRAGVGGVLYLLAAVAGREASGLSVLCAVGVGFVAAEPAVFADVGFRLSFASVLGILLLGARWEELLVPTPIVIPGATKAPRAWGRRSLAVSLGAWWATAPIVVAQLGQACPAAPLASLVAVPVGSLVLGVGFALLAAAPLPLAGDAAAWAFARSSDALRLVLDGCVATGLGSRAVDAPAWPWHVLYLAAFAAGSVGPRRALVPSGVAMTVLLLAVVPPRTPEPPVAPRIVLLDVGRAQAAVVLLPDGRAALLGSGLTPRARAATVLPALRALGVGATVEPPLAGRWGRLDAPEGAFAVLEAHGRRVVLAGDGEPPGALAADALVLPRGGRDADLSERWLDATGARTVLASCDRATRPRLPPGTVATAARGALVVDVAPCGLVVSSPWDAERESDGYDPARVAAVLPHAPAGASVWLVPLALLLFAAVAVRPLRWLTPGGAAAACALGVAAFLTFGGAALAALFAPFVVATVLGKLPGGPDDGPRDLRRVAANGLASLAGIAVAWAGRPDVGLAVFLGNLAGLGGDTCATEIGVRWGGTPRSLLGKPLARGESGGVTVAGLLGAIAGAALAPLAWLLATSFDVRVLGALTAAGVGGSLVDSLLGATLQWRGRDPATGAVTESRRAPERVSGRRWMDNDAVNLAGGAAAALLAVALLGAG